MLCFIADNYPSIIGSPAEQALENMALESFLVHYRNIRDFLFPTQSIEQPDFRDKARYQQAIDCVLGSDFNPPGWNFGDRDWKEVVLNERDRINKQLSHISYSRSRMDPKWPLPKMRDALVAQVNEFLKSLPKERRAYFSQLDPWVPEILS